MKIYNTGAKYAQRPNMKSATNRLKAPHYKSTTLN